MSTVISSPALSQAAADRAARRGEPAPVPFLRLVRVEARKQLDTRAGRWILIVIGIVTAGVLAVMAAVAGGDHPFQVLIGVLVTPLSLLLPVVGILAATAEWSQRTGLVTFTLEPRRTRVSAAKLLASLGIGLVAALAAVALAALTHVALIATRGAEASWSVEGDILGGGLLMIALSMVQGVAFGLVLLNTPAALVSFFVLPTLFSFLGLVPALVDVMPWIDLSRAGAPVLTGQAGGDEWVRFAVAATIWVVVPLIAGLVRVNRTEIKSS